MLQHGIHDSKSQVWMQWLVYRKIWQDTPCSILNAVADELNVEKKGAAIKGMVQAWVAQKLLNATF